VQTGGTELNSFEAALFYITYIVVVAGIIILVFRFYKGQRMFALMEALVILLATGFIIFAILDTIFYTANAYYITAIAGIATLILIIAKNLHPKLRNMLAVTSSMGVGILIGLNGFYLAYFLMLLIAVYDYIAVFVTKHMISMAREMSSRNLAFLIGSSDVEAVPNTYMTKKDLSSFKKNFKDSKNKDPFIKDLVKGGYVPMVSQVQLGSGDLAIPLMVAVSVYISFLNYFAAIMVTVGSACGMIFTMYLLKKYKVALPAIPPLFAFVSLFVAIIFAMQNPGNFPVWGGFLVISIVTIAFLLQKLRSRDSP